MEHIQKIEVTLPQALQKQLERVEKKLDQFLGGEKSTNLNLGEFIPEEQAKKLLGKKTTWFFYKRRDGYLKSYKVGQKNFYKMSDLLKLVEDGEQ